MDTVNSSEPATIRWHEVLEGRWSVSAQSSGGQELVVERPFAFRVVPNAVLPW